MPDIHRLRKSTSFSRNSHLALNDSNYFETRGLNFFVFSNLYDATFDDSKISAVEIIHHASAPLPTEMSA